MNYRKKPIPLPQPPPRRRLRRGGGVGTRGPTLSTLLALAVVGAASLWARSEDHRESKGEGPRPLPSALASLQPHLDAAGCESLELFDSEGRTHLHPGETFDDYRSVPPLSGAHAPQPLPASPAVLAEEKPKEALVHNLEHGYVVLWHAGLSSSESAALAQAVNGLEKVLVTPIRYAELPGEARVAITGWQQRMLCHSVDARIVSAVTTYLRGGDSLAPEPSGR